MRFSRDFIEKVEQAADIVTVIADRGIPMKKAGATYKALCPFHSEKTPSFNINPQRGFFHCFGCGVGGGAIKFVMEYDKLSFVDTLTELANRFGVPLEQPLQTGSTEQQDDRPLKALQISAHFYHELLGSVKGEAGKTYFQERNISEQLQKQFNLGYIPDEWQLLFQHLSSQGFKPNDMMNAGLIKSSQKSGRPYDAFRSRVIFPIRDPRGRCIAFGGRAIEPGQQPKYINSPESKYYHKSKILYGFYEGLNFIKQKRELILVEGYLDVIRLHEHGFQQAVATCGTALTVDHLRFAKRYVDKIILILDGDQAGQNAALKSCPLFLANKMEASIVSLPPGEDPDTLLLNQGTSKFNELLQGETPVFEFFVKQSLAKYHSNVQGRTMAIEEMLPMIREIQDETIKNLTLQQLAEMLRLPVSSILEMAPKSLHSKQRHDSLSNLHPEVSAIYEDRDEKRIVQILLFQRESITIAREHLHAYEFSTPHLRQIYEGLLRFSDEDFQKIPIDELNTVFPDHAAHFARLQLERLAYEPEEAPPILKRSIRQVKEKILNQVYQEELQEAQADELKILHAGREFRIQKQALDQLFPAR